MRKDRALTAQVEHNTGYLFHYGFRTPRPRSSGNTFLRSDHRCLPALPSLVRPSDQPQASVLRFFILHPRSKTLLARNELRMPNSGRVGGSRVAYARCLSSVESCDAMTNTFLCCAANTSPMIQRLASCSLSPRVYCEDECFADDVLCDSASEINYIHLRASVSSSSS